MATILNEPVILVVLLLVAHIYCSNGYSSQVYSEHFAGEELMNGETFDFIVAGGGTAGCAVAARLAENGEHTVLLIEAGVLPHPDHTIPAFTPRLHGDPNVSRIYPSVRQLNAALDQNGTVNFLRGHMLGGTGILSGRVLNRGSPHDYNNWAKITGDESWNYANMLKYFRKFENYSGDSPSDQRGFHGPITVSRASYAPGSSEWLRAGRELGYEISEPNGPQVISFNSFDFARKNGRNVNSYSSYVEPLLRKSNLRVLINTEVNRIVFDGNRAIGVKFTSTGPTRMGWFAKAKKEVIVSMGVVDTPALLMKSGIGPKSVLDGAGIPPVKYLPVGRNFHDHVLSSLVVAIGNRSAAFDEDTELTPAAWRLFQEYGEGPYTSFMGASTQAFLGSSTLPPSERHMGWPDIQLIPFFGNSRRNGIWDPDQVLDVREGEIIMPWVALVGRPRSRGTVTLNSTDVDGMPLLDFQFLTNPYDIRVLVEGLKTLANICERTEAFRKIGCRIPEISLPACDVHIYRSDGYWECYGRQKSRFGTHAVGSCRMGRGPEDQEAVVDSKLRVIGIGGLRVADASVMPTITNTNTQAAVHAIAEKASDMILQNWSRLITTSSSHIEADEDEDWSRRLNGPQSNDRSLYHIFS